MVNRTNLTIWIMLALSMLFGGWVAVILGKELCWDLAHYHYYNPFAFLYARQGMDIWPNTFIHQFINPTIDFLSWFLINSFTPRMTEFVLGAIHGINLWLLFLLARRFLPAACNLVFAAFLALLGIYGPTALQGMGSFQNDNLISIFVLGFIWFQLKALDSFLVSGKIPHKLLFASGLLLGLGFGLKFTAGIYVAGALLTILILPLPAGARIKWALSWGAGTLLGTLLTAGYWMYLMWLRHHNPFFPFFNGVFHSPDFMYANWRDERFLPKGIMQTLFYPFYFSVDGHRVADASFQDFRFPVIYILFLLAGMRWSWKKGKTPILHFWLFAFFIFTYLIWQIYFSIARYLVVLEMLSPLVIYLLILQLTKNVYAQLVALFAAFYIMIVFLVPLPMVRAPWYDTSFFNVVLPDSVRHRPKATVLITHTAFVMDSNPRPQAYLIPFFPAQWRFIGVPFWHEHYLADKVVTSKIVAALSATKDKIYLLTTDYSLPEAYRTAAIFRVAKDGECEEIFSDRQAITNQHVLLCPLKRL